MIISSVIELTFRVSKQSQLGNILKESHKHDTDTIVTQCTHISYCVFVCVTKHIVSVISTCDVRLELILQYKQSMIG